MGRRPSERLEQVPIAVRLERVEQVGSNNLLLDRERPEQRRRHHSITAVELVGIGAEASREDVEIANSAELIADPLELATDPVHPFGIEYGPNCAERRAEPADRHAHVV